MKTKVVASRRVVHVVCEDSMCEAIYVNGDLIYDAGDINVMEFIHEIGCGHDEPIYLSCRRTACDGVFPKVIERLPSCES